MSKTEAPLNNYQNFTNQQWELLQTPILVEPKPNNNWSGTVKFIPAQVTETAPKPAQKEVISPFFDLQKSVHLYRNLVEIYGEKRGQEIALQVFIGDVRSQLWELRETPMPFQYRMYLRKVNGQMNLVHESDLHAGTDIMQGLTPDIRHGLEVEQMKLVKEAAINCPIGGEVDFISPMRDERTETAKEVPYPDSIHNRFIRIDAETFLCEQQLEKFTPAEMVRWMNKMAGRPLLSEDAHIPEILRTVVTFQKAQQLTDIWQKREQVSGKPISKFSHQELLAQDEKFNRLATIGGARMLEWMKAQIEGSPLNSNYVSMMSEFLHGVESTKIHRNEDGSVSSFEFSCGSVGSMASLLRNGVLAKEGKEGETIKCPDCNKDNTCIGKDKLCNFCGSKLTN